MRRTTLRTGQELTCVVQPCPIRSFRAPFFCVAKVRVTNVAWPSTDGSAVRESNWVVLCHSWTSAMQNGWEDGPALEYSPGRRRKKKANHIKSDAADDVTSLAWRAMLVAKCNSASGSGFTLVGGASVLAKLRSSRVRRVSVVLEPAAQRGSGRPTMVNVCATAWSASATVLDRTALPLAENRPSRTRRAKTWSHATGSGQVDK